MMTTETITLREMTIRYSASTAERGAPVLLSRFVLRASDVAPALVTLLQLEVAEVFVIVCLSTKCEVIAYHRVSRGTLDSAPVHPREVFKAALLANAASLILAHNHPSGDPTPSRDDVALTRRLADAGRLLGIPVSDHLVIGIDGWTSLRDLGVL
jgi:DNA repair protein RadC